MEENEKNKEQIIIDDNDTKRSKRPFMNFDSHNYEN